MATANQTHQMHAGNIHLPPIRVHNARENNLKNVSLDIPKRKITVFTGVSGSGKSSLVFDTIAAESQRQLYETFSTFVRNRLPHHGQPEVDVLENLAVSIVVDQKRLGGNARSTVGTSTDIHPLLRLLFSRAGRPHVGESTAFSFNDPSGMCPACSGLGAVVDIDVNELFDTDKSLNEGAIRFPTFAVGSVRWKRYVYSGLFDNDRKLADYGDQEWSTLLYDRDRVIRPAPPGWPPTSKFEGVITRFRRSYLDRESDPALVKYRADFDRVLRKGPCSECGGSRLNEAARSARIGDLSIADCAAMQISDLLATMRTKRMRQAAGRGRFGAAAEPIIAAITERLSHVDGIGLGYLSLDRSTTSLSGGESQRVKMVRHLGSSLTDVTYVFDEPSVGLHPRDVHRLTDHMIRLRDKGNTVLVVEHDPAVIAVADHVVDMGPGAGRAGGEIIYQGTPAGLADAGTLTGKHFHRAVTVSNDPRPATGHLWIHHANKNNLHDVSVRIPMGVFTAVTGVAGSGKSSLINGELAAMRPDAVFVNQNAIRGAKRSNPATYTGMMDEIRKLYARENAAAAGLFSSNSRGACPTCRGLGTTSIDLAFLDPVVGVCETCRGRRFTDQVLQHTLRGRNISEVLDMTVTDALDFFVEPPITSPLRRLIEVGLEYVSLGQSLDTFSGGERQRLKLATAMDRPSGLYVLDEPTAGLHPADVEHLLVLLNRLVDAGGSVVVIEHDQDVISQADWIIDLGPGAGHQGGRVVFEGTPHDLIAADTETARYFAAASHRPE